MGVADISNEDRRMQRKNRWNIRLGFVDGYALYFLYLNVRQKFHSKGCLHGVNPNDKITTEILNQQN